LTCIAYLQLCLAINRLGRLLAQPDDANSETFLFFMKVALASNLSPAPPLQHQIRSSLGFLTN
jgi:hypothetical protein